MNDEPPYPRRRRWAAVALLTLFRGADADALLADDAELRRSVAALAGDTFEERENATKALAGAGEAAVPFVVAAAKSGDRETTYRALVVLDRLASADESGARKAARRALAELSKADDAQVARAAREKLEKFVATAVARLRSSGGDVNFRDGRVWSISFANHAIGDATLVPLDDLEPVQLNLTRTQVADETLARLAGHTQLELLNLMATKVTDEGMKHLAGLSEMRTFSVERTAVTDAGLAHLRGFDKLKILYLGGSKVAGPGLKHVEHLPVEYLSFAYSRVDDSVVEHVVRLKGLKTLGLDDTQVTDACLPALASLENLEVLWLDNCGAITDAGVPHLARLTKLKTLHVQRTGISAQGFAQLKVALATTEINGAPGE